MRRSLAALGLAVTLATSTVAAVTAPAQAQPVPSVQSGPSPIKILTRVSVATGGYVEPTTGEWVVDRPYYPIDVRVICPAGESGRLWTTPVFLNSTGRVNFTCTGKPQRVRTYAGAVNGVSTLGWHQQTPTARLQLVTPSATPGGLTTVTTLGEETQRVWVYTAQAKAAYY